MPQTFTPNDDKTSIETDAGTVTEGDRVLFEHMPIGSMVQGTYDPADGWPEATGTVEEITRTGGMIPVRIAIETDGDSKYYITEHDIKEVNPD